MNNISIPFGWLKGSYFCAWRCAWRAFVPILMWCCLWDRICSLQHLHLYCLYSFAPEFLCFLLEAAPALSVSAQLWFQAAPVPELCWQCCCEVTACLRRLPSLPRHWMSPLLGVPSICWTGALGAWSVFPDKDGRLLDQCCISLLLFQ